MTRRGEHRRASFVVWSKATQRLALGIGRGIAGGNEGLDAFRQVKPDLVVQLLFDAPAAEGEPKDATKGP